MAIDISDVGFCAIDDTGLVCTGHRLAEGRPELEDPISISLGEGQSGIAACAIDSDGVVCWGENQRGELDVPELDNPRAVSAGNHEACAIDDSGIVCWGWSHNTYGKIVRYAPSYPQGRGDE